MRPIVRLYRFTPVATCRHPLPPSSARAPTLGLSAMAMTALTPGCISSMFRQSPAPKDPVVQITDLKQMGAEGAPKRIK